MVRIASKQPRKQRKIRYNASTHQRSRFLSAPLSKDLREEYKRRRARVVSGDTVQVLRGEHAGTEGVVDSVDTKKGMIEVHGVTVAKTDGTEVPRPVNASNVMITKLKTEDPRRVAKLEERK
ncbi:50S ribosomal protein L24 [Methanofollis aquaemaris]|uniref:Large ribosomal subunit protein uL24 n=1 Tax=Methanofollis aquaemaris TaxID=126734 RepID=A0A8A3S699_9EURY|nr:50S ribosomal protein L24 [Methanofollis aquaemaris]QSZ67136.1 50S ribosomal protein L24 [Methanofollis aquaemaris]